MRANRVFKVMNRPLTILGAERRLLLVALLVGAGVFNLLHSLREGIDVAPVGDQIQVGMYSRLRRTWVNIFG